MMKASLGSAMRLVSFGRGKGRARRGRRTPPSWMMGMPPPAGLALISLMEVESRIHGFCHVLPFCPPIGMKEMVWTIRQLLPVDLFSFGVVQCWLGHGHVVGLCLVSLNLKGGGGGGA